LSSELSDGNVSAFSEAELDTYRDIVTLSVGTSSPVRMYGPGVAMNSQPGVLATSIKVRNGWVARLCSQGSGDGCTGTEYRTTTINLNRTWTALVVTRAPRGSRLNNSDCLAMVHGGRNYCESGECQSECVRSVGPVGVSFVPGSVSVRDGFSLEICSKPTSTGSVTCERYVRDAPDVKIHNLNTIISSMKLSQDIRAVKSFELADFKGEAVVAPSEGDYTAVAGDTSSSFELAERLGSIVVSRGYAATLCRGQSPGGVCVQYWNGTNDAWWFNSAVERKANFMRVTWNADTDSLLRIVAENDSSERIENVFSSSTPFSISATFQAISSGSPRASFVVHPYTKVYVCSGNPYAGTLTNPSTQCVALENITSEFETYTISKYPTLEKFRTARLWLVAVNNRMGVAKPEGPRADASTGGVELFGCAKYSHCSPGLGLVVGTSAVGAHVSTQAGGTDFSAIVTRSIKLLPSSTGKKYKAWLCSDSPRTNKYAYCYWVHEDIPDLAAHKLPPVPRLTGAGMDTQRDQVELNNEFDKFKNGQVWYVALYPEAPPIILVHGFMGFGRGELFKDLVYWGGWRGEGDDYSDKDDDDIERQLNLRGWETYTATVGPLSSNYDRAVELYKQIKGPEAQDGSDDCPQYGTAHTNMYHRSDANTVVLNSRSERLCRSVGLYPYWSASKPVHLVGHSMGGQTVRMLASLLRHGEYWTPNVAERAPAFANEKPDGWVKSVTTINTPNNGTTLANSLVDPGLTGDFISTAVVDIAGRFVEQTAGLQSRTRGVYDWKLDQFGIVSTPDDPVFNNSKVTSRYFWQQKPSAAGANISYKDGRTASYSSVPKWSPTQNDISTFDLSVEGAAYLNVHRIQIVRHAYYFAFGSRRASDSAQTVPTASLMEGWYLKRKVTGTALSSNWWHWNDADLTSTSHWPTTNMCLNPRCVRLRSINQWEANDGVVNLVSMRAPFNEPSAEVPRPLPSMAAKGIWYEEIPYRDREGEFLDYDHLNIVGINVLSQNPGKNRRLQEFYYDHAKYLHDLP
jgi:triacylglycerol lipase